MRESFWWWNPTYKILFSGEEKEAEISVKAEHVGGNIWTGEMSQKNRNVLYLVRLASWGEKLVLSRLSGTPWIRTHSVQLYFLILPSRWAMTCLKFLLLPIFIFIHQLPVYTLRCLFTGLLPTKRLHSKNLFISHPPTFLIQCKLFGKCTYEWIRL